MIIKSWLLCANGQFKKVKKKNQREVLPYRNKYPRKAINPEYTESEKFSDTNENVTSE